MSSALPASSKIPSPREVYFSRDARYARDARDKKRDYDRISNARMLAFIGTFACAFAGVYWPPTPVVDAVCLAAALVCLAAFVVLLAKHAGVHRERERTAGLQQINQEALARLDCDWSKLPLPTAPAFVADHPLTHDLDLFGRGSLYHLICTAGTPQGRRVLAETLLQPAANYPSKPEIIYARQAAVEELADALDFRQDLQLGAREFASGAGAEKTSIVEDPLLTWISTEPFLLRRPKLVWTTRILPVLILGLGFASLTIGAGWPFALVILLISRWMLTTRGTGREVSRQLGMVCSKERDLHGYSQLFSLLAKWETRPPELRRLAECLRGADTAMNSLNALVGLAAIRTTPASPLAQWVFLWDFHTLYLMERWQERHGPQVRGWFEALGEVEALASLATLKFDQPAWPFPQFTDEARIEARALGHPLLPASSRVVNDVTLGPPGTFLLVTGSNMSGKSTLLRTLGVNVVLAQAGAPVCAEALRLPAAITLATSLRVEDSLQEGVSFFMAELRRLASVVEAADAIPEAPGSPVLLYLLDEILRGTNTEERQIIVGKVVMHLLGRRAIGAISTHDLSLAEVPALASATQTVHFREDFEEGPDGAIMRFDYQMRPGLSTTTNALKLLRVIGLKL